MKVPPTIQDNKVNGNYDASGDVKDAREGRAAKIAQLPFSRSLSPRALSASRRDCFLHSWREL